MNLLFRAILLGVFLSLGNRLSAQNTDFVKDQGITSEFHHANFGRILFMESETPVKTLKTIDFLNKYTLTNNSNLYITVFLAHSNTNYLHLLQPGINSDSLLKSGNYQFSFFVDSKLIYKSNLWPGAPRAAQQNFETVWCKPLIDNQHEGRWWSQSVWNRFMHFGGDSALTEGNHMLKIEIRDYLQAKKLLIGDVIASGELKLLVNRVPAINFSRIALNNIKPYDGLMESTENFDRKKIIQLKGEIEADVYKHITSVVVIRNGKLLVEEYFNGSNRDSLHDVRSVGKSFTSTLMGIALQEGYLKTTKQTLNNFFNLKKFNNYTEAKKNTSLEELLTMSSKFNGNDEDEKSPGQEGNMYPTTNWLKFALDLPLDTISYKGQWHYFTAGMIILGEILNKVVPDGLEAYAEKSLFRPLGISNYKWQYTPQKVVNTAGGIQMNSLDFGKFGQLYKNNGVWMGKQILSNEWVRKTFTRHKVIPGRTKEYYGYLFWNKTYQINGNKYETYYCAGNGGNKIFVFKDQPLVVVVTAEAYGVLYAHSQVDRMMEKYILPAVIR